MTASAAMVGLHPLGDTLTVITARTDPFSNAIEVYPNPASNRFTVHSDPPMAKAAGDSRGRLVLERKNLNHQFETFDTAQLAAGCYFLEVHSETGIQLEKVDSKLEIRTSTIRGKHNEKIRRIHILACNLSLLGKGPKSTTSRFPEGLQTSMEVPPWLVTRYMSQLTPATFLATATLQQ